MSNLRPVERELKDRKDGPLQLRIRPYRTSDNKVDGAVITFIGMSPDEKENDRLAGGL